MTFFSSLKGAPLQVRPAIFRLFLYAAALALAAAFSCVPSKTEKILATSVPAAVLSCAPSKGSAGGGEQVNVWVACGSFTGSGASVFVGGCPATVENSQGPYSGCLWALTIRTPALPRGFHDVEARLPGEKPALLENGWFAVPDVLSVTGSVLVSGLPGPFRMAAGNLLETPGIELCVAHSGAGSEGLVGVVSGISWSGAACSFFDAGGAVVDVAALDIDFDGIGEILALCSDGPSSFSIRVFKRSGQEFGLLQSISCGNDPSCFFAGSLERSPGPGVAVGYSSQALETWLAADQSSLKFKQALACPGVFTGLCAADFDSDGEPDMAAACPGNDAFFLVKGAGAGVFGAPVSAGSVSSPAHIASSDLDLDGVPDIAVVSSSGKAAVFLGSGASFSAAGIADFPAALARFRLADADGNAILDMAGAGSTAFSIHSGDGSGYFVTGKTLVHHFSSAVSDFAVIDVDSDGFPDFLVAEPGSGMLHICRNTSH